MPRGNSVRGLLKLFFKRAWGTKQHPLSAVLSTKRQKDRKRTSLLFDHDPFFTRVYGLGVSLSGTPDNRRRPQRYYNLVQFLEQVMELDGAVAECGCWKGLSSYILLNAIRRRKPDYQGADFYIFDSFEGLSEPTGEDEIKDPAIGGRIKFAGLAGKFVATVEEVKTVLADFQEVTFCKGWIPGSFSGLTERLYKFVHIDLDLYAPIRHSVGYFYPRLAQGGIMVFDDYGSMKWPGARKAVDEYCAENGIRPLLLSTGQAIIWAKRF